MLQYLSFSFYELHSINNTYVINLSIKTRKNAKELLKEREIEDKLISCDLQSYIITLTIIYYNIYEIREREREKEDEK